MLPLDILNWNLVKAVVRLKYPLTNKGKEPPEFMSTHPSSDTRIKQLNEWMNEVILDYPPINLT